MVAVRYSFNDPARMEDLPRDYPLVSVEVLLSEDGNTCLSHIQTKLHGSYTEYDRNHLKMEIGDTVLFQQSSSITAVLRYLKMTHSERIFMKAQVSTPPRDVIEAIAQTIVANLYTPTRKSKQMQELEDSARCCNNCRTKTIDFMVAYT
ncbi:hypothetical protein Tco_0755384 [Tanacetum coccineum]